MVIDMNLCICIITLLALIGIAISWWLLDKLVDRNWRRRPLRNFEFKYHGANFWYSRSVACQLIVFGKDAEGKWYVLAKERLTKCGKMKWNVPFAYLEHGENAETCVNNETLEETGIVVPVNGIKLLSVNTNPQNHKQNVILRYFVVINDVINEDAYKPTKDGAEWIPIDSVCDRIWAFKHDKDIMRAFEGLKM